MFSVTFEIVTPESAEHGEAADMGYINESCDLRTAIADLFETRTSQCDGITGIDECGTWITVYNGMEYLTGAHESRSLHVPSNITPSSYDRIARLIIGA